MTTNDKLLPGLGLTEVKPLSIGQTRRAGFAALGADFSRGLAGYAASNVGLGIPGASAQDESDARAIMAAPTFRRNVMEFLAAQFAIRMLMTRAKMEHQARHAAIGGVVKARTSEVEKFADAAVLRLLDLSTEHFGQFELVSHPGPKKAWDHISTEYARIGLDAMRMENSIPALANVWDETRFWRDFFLGLADPDLTGCAAHGFSVVYLDHSDAYAKALRDDVAAEMRAGLRVVQGKQG